MKTYAWEVEVSASDIDENNHVNNLVYLHWAQKISGMHWKAWASDKFINSILWVVKSQSIQYLKQVHLNHQIKLITWVEKSSKADSIRRVDIWNLTKNELAATVTIHWFALDRESGKPMRIPTEIADVFVGE